MNRVIQIELMMLKHTGPITETNNFQLQTSYSSKNKRLSIHSRTLHTHKNAIHTHFYFIVLAFRAPTVHISISSSFFST